MNGRFAIAIGAAMLFATVALASEVTDKCVADVTPLGSPDPEGQCACFAENITEEQAKEYLEITDWAAQASDEMKEVGVMCFPEIN
jgi:hypothetical protein